MFFILKGVAKTSSFLQRRVKVGLLNSVINYSSVDNTHSKKIFEKLDSNKDGIVDKNDLKKEVLDTFLYTFEYNDETLEKAFSRLDKAKKGSVSVEDVESYLSSLKFPSEDMLKSEFQLMDLDKDGSISLDDMIERYSLGKGDILRIILRREFKMMGKERDIDRITLEEFIDRNYYRYFLASVFQINDILEDYV